MTIDEAIEIETIHNDHNPNFTDEQRRQAHQLGIEALIRVKIGRGQAYEPYIDSLPGETKD